MQNHAFQKSNRKKGTQTALVEIRTIYSILPWYTLFLPFIYKVWILCLMAYIHGLFIGIYL